MEKIIYEDAHVIVLHKPGGIPVQTRRLGQKDMVSILKNYRVSKKEEPYIGVIHRLDQPVEGVLVFAKTKDAASKLSRQFQGCHMDKYYRAVVYNRTNAPLKAGDRAILTDYLFKDGRTNCSKVVKEGTGGAKKGVLQYEVVRVNESENLAEVSVRLKTGRHHQIRVQMAEASLPLVGDCKYGWKDAPVLKGAGKNIALCSVKITFRHPKTKEKMEFETQPENLTFGLV